MGDKPNVVASFFTWVAQEWSRPSGLEAALMEDLRTYNAEVDPQKYGRLIE